MTALTSSILALALLPAPQQAPPIQALIVTGANNHDWEWTSPRVQATLAETGRFQVEVTTTPAIDLRGIDARHAAGEVDLIVLDYNGPRWGEDAERAFLAAVRSGCGVSVVHAANNAFNGWEEYEVMVGLLWRGGTGHGRYHPFDVHVVDHAHPITAGMEDLRAHPDELYHRLVHKAGAQYRVLMSAFSAPESGGTGRHEPMATAGTYGAGRVFHTPLGHVWRNNLPSRATWRDPQLRCLLARGSEWAATGAVTLSPTPLNRLSPEERKAGFELLFDGQSIERWTGFKQEHPPEKGWTVRDAAIVHERGGGGGDLVSRADYRDFDFRFSFRVAKGANSGVMWHVTNEGQQTYFSGPEYQVLDDGALDPGDTHSVGALYDLVGPTGKAALPAGRWNDGRIVVHEGRLQHYLNGQKVIDCPCAGPEWKRMVAASKFRDWPFGQAEAGKIALQDHGDEVAFRNLRIRQL
jgi:type 1 glutamine amidotransferase